MQRLNIKKPFSCSVFSLLDDCQRQQIDSYESIEMVKERNEDFRLTAPFELIGRYQNK
jgi:hypothetical protein